MVKEENAKSDLLSSWKEIARYLGVDVRTCHRWERSFGLPIRRLGGGSRSRVFAHRGDLDRWLAERSGNHLFNGEKSSRPEFGKSVSRPFILAAILITAAVVIVFFLAWPKMALLLGGSGDPADFRIEGSILVILDAKGVETGRFDAGRPDLRPEPWFKRHFQRRQLVEAPYLPFIMFKDVLGDSDPEVLFAPVQNDEHDSGLLCCLDKRGRLLWAYETGRTIVTGLKPFVREYVIRGFDVADIDRDGRMEIVIISHYTHDFPTQVSLLDDEGKIESEYWNSGQLSDLIFLDLDGDGIEEILLIGQNNEYEKGCLVVLDPREIRGASHQETSDYAIEGMWPGTEKYYILFPWTDLDEVSKPGIAVNVIEVMGGQSLNLTIAPSMVSFELDFSMRLISPRLSHGTEILHRQAILEGRLSTPLNKAECLRKLASGLLWWDGDRWVSSPAQNKSWARR